MRMMIGQVYDVPEPAQSGCVGKVDGVEIGFLNTGHVVYVWVQVVKHVFPGVE